MVRRDEDLLSEVRQIELHKVSGEEWDAVFDKLLELVGANEADIVDSALERAVTAIWAEKYGPIFDPNAEKETSRTRLESILSRLEQRSDVVERVLDFASHTGSMAGDEEFVAGFLAWADRFQPPPDETQKWADAAEVIRLRLGALGDDWETASPQLMELLSHSSVQVRACAANALGLLISEDGREAARLTDMMRVIHDAEIERPGIAGPFYGAVQSLYLEELSGGGRAAIKAWMLSILENRKATEPPLPEFHFNGIDFYAHQLFSDDPDGVRDLMRIGRNDIAVAAAADKNEIVVGMEDLLVELGNSDDEDVCRSTSWQLAYLYRILHPRGHKRGFVSEIPVPGGKTLLLNGFPESPRHPYAAILYSPAGQPFKGDEVHQCIDRLLPMHFRGATVPFYSGDWHGGTLYGGQVSSDEKKVHFSWTCGALGMLRGDASAREWESLTIVWHGEKGTWAPGDYVNGL